LEKTIDEGKLARAIEDEDPQGRLHISSTQLEDIFVADIVMQKSCSDGENAQHCLKTEAQHGTSQPFGLQIFPYEERHEHK
jgi:hypothetical protein